MRGDATILLESSLTTSILNAGSSKHSRPSLHARTEPGWTETWGGSPSSRDSSSDDARLRTSLSRRWSEWMPPSDWDRHEIPYAARTAEAKSMPLLLRPSSSMSSSASASGGVHLTLTQHRPAWLEQLVLRVAGVPHAVINSPYSCSEASGPLPFLMDLGGGGGGGGGAAGKDGRAAPGLVGRRNPGGMAGETITSGGGDGGEPGDDGAKVAKETSPPSSGAAPSGGGLSSACRSDIVEYLRLLRSVDLDAGLSPELRSESLAYSSLIAGDLDAALSALRYGDDDAWDQVYRPQCIEACLRPDFDGYGIASPDRRYAPRRWGAFHWVASLQARTERISALRGLLLSNGRTRDELFDGRDVRADVAVRRARSCYDALEAKLAGRGNDGEERRIRYLLRTDRPTTVDAALFAHLAEALCDVHLVVALAEYPHLVRFFQDTHEAYFGREYVGSDGGRGGGRGSGTEDSTPADRPEWVRWNDAANARNAFNRLPLGEGGIGGAAAGGGEFKEAIAIMQSMALRRRDLGEALSDAALRRRMEDERDGRQGGAASENAPCEMFHRWRMGGSLSRDDSENDHKKGARDGKNGDGAGSGGSGGGSSAGGEQEDEMTRKNREHMERMVRESRTNDELWVSGVVLASVLAFAVAAAKAAGAH